MHFEGTIHCTLIQQVWTGIKMEVYILDKMFMFNYSFSQLALVAIKHISG